jgi:hypothetical protein
LRPEYNNSSDNQTPERHFALRLSFLRELRKGDQHMDNCGAAFDAGSFANVWERVSPGAEPDGEAERLRAFIDGETARLRAYASLAARAGGETGNALRSLAATTKQWPSALRARLFVLTGENYKPAPANANTAPSKHIREALRELCASELHAQESYRKAASDPNAATGLANLYTRLEAASSSRADALTAILGRIL